MILTCPNCGTQYAVKDGAIPPEGRQVRCASCKHSWHQDPEPAQASESALPAGEPELEADQLDGGADEGDESLAEATLIEPRSGPEAEERAYEEAIIEGGAPDAAPATENTGAEPAPEDWREPPEGEGAEDLFSPFATPDGAAPSRRSGAVRILVIALLVAALVAAVWFFAPAEWKARLGIAAGATSPLALVTTHMDRQRLESGNELLTVTGRVINPTGKEQDVPPLQAQLRTRAGKVVYSWTIAPPARTLPAGASASFNSAEVNVPPGGEELTISLGSPSA
jgi:predicted Zn finger-like uncharacterized protein